MAVTQQLAMLGQKELQDCINDQKILEELVSFDLLDRSAYLDLNWEVVSLANAIKEFGNEYFHDYDLSLDGKYEFNKYEIKFVVDDFPKYLLSDEVEKIYESLKKIDIDKILSQLPNDLEKINKLLKSEYDKNPRSILRNVYFDLLGFYKKASENYLCVVCWWD